MAPRKRTTKTIKIEELVANSGPAISNTTTSNYTTTTVSQGKSKKRIAMFALFLPIILVGGVLLYLSLNRTVDESPPPAVTDVDCSFPFFACWGYVPGGDSNQKSDLDKIPTVAETVEDTNRIVVLEEKYSKLEEDVALLRTDVDQIKKDISRIDESVMELTEQQNVILTKLHSQKKTVVTRKNRTKITKVPERAPPSEATQQRNFKGRFDNGNGGSKKERK